MANKVLDGSAKEMVDCYCYTYRMYKVEDKTNETMDGEADGTNKVFSFIKTDVVDSDGNTAVAGTPTVKDDGVGVAISSLDAAKGEVTLTVAPANGSVMTATYKHTGVHRDHKVSIAKSGMTDQNDENEAKASSDSEAATVRTAYLAEGNPVVASYPAQEGDVNL